MSDTDLYEGEVTIPLRQFMYLEAKARQLKTVERQLDEERGRTWELFGNFFHQKRTLRVIEDPSQMARQYIIEVKQPLTKMMVQHYNLSSKWDVAAIHRKLVEEHILDVVKAVDAAKQNPRLYP